MLIRKIIALPSLFVALAVAVGCYAYVIKHPQEAPSIPTNTEQGTSITPTTSTSTVTNPRPQPAPATKVEGTVKSAPAASSTPTKPKPEAAKQTTYQIPVERSGTVIDAMNAYASQTFTFETSTYPGLGIFVESVNGVKNGNGHYWFLYVNGKSSDTGASATRVQPGDTVEWRYQ